MSTNITSEQVADWMRDRVNEIRAKHPGISGVSLGFHNNFKAPYWTVWHGLHGNEMESNHTLDVAVSEVLRKADPQNAANKRREEARRLLAEADELDPVGRVSCASGE